MRTDSPKFIFMVPHIQPYLLVGIKELVKGYNASVLVVAWPTPDIAPVGLGSINGMTVVHKTQKNKEQIKQRILSFSADIVFGSGWMDKDYLEWCAILKASGKKVVMGMDNQWKGTFRQHVNSIFSYFTIKRHYTHAWVPGDLQYEYARRLGFTDDKILRKLYIPDTILFNKYYHLFLDEKKNAYPKNILYVGRLVGHKAGNMLKAFVQLTDEELGGWKLMIVGNGPLDISNYAENKNIMFRPFVQQDELGPIVSKAGVFCLVSFEEPWGMVIQEYAAAGLPLLLSKQCGAWSSMLRPGENGYLCDGYSVEDIKEKIKMMIAHTPERLLEMGRISNEIGSADEPSAWAATLMSIY